MLIEVYTRMGMTFAEFKKKLLQHADGNLRFVLPDGDLIAADFHVTEVGHVVKKFIDCGGTRRTTESVTLQVWVAANDAEHRLTASKLASILDLAKSVVPTEDLPVEVEYEGCAISQYPVVDARMEGNELRFALADKHTDCLAKEACGLEDCGCAPAAAPGNKCC